MFFSFFWIGVLVWAPDQIKLNVIDTTLEELALCEELELRRELALRDEELELTDELELCDELDDEFEHPLELDELELELSSMSSLIELTELELLEHEDDDDCG